MRILCLCDWGENRSVTVANALKFRGHETVAAGFQSHSPETLKYLIDWADRVILTAHDQMPRIERFVQDGLISWDDRSKMQLWDIGPDIYPRPFNRNLLQRVRTFVAQHSEDYPQVMRFWDEAVPSTSRRKRDL